MSYTQTPPKTDREFLHQKQVRQQIFLPLVIVLLFILALMGLSILGAFQEGDLIHHLGNISSILLISPLILANLINLFLLIIGVRAINHLLRKLPFWMEHTQQTFQKIEEKTQSLCNALVSPLIKINSHLSTLGTLKKKKGL
ncbi:hypothetical protein [Anaerolinea thermophila]|uniref:Methyl-accepting chemotaxis protein n=1 Tax=Anaerolinea thermophila (strain DSM 14523 / JCM 11388 / NBRC 100420 / UNI-1) TaxID=926569 RepID=E8N5C4_ANATU|nr:hypothetical protein [Anaerolinea thermophila]BAJ63638.1 hypothetical protein ANT_16120 [Anaerolinea thermophila UNI-1]